ncbi:MAG: type II toxin-antitoxin system HipA family toxin YjjJ [Desulfuromonadales bacterium]|nr:type II toxin-antitoxin system HipA family toxin YjjJ [Desulfuromonadales bacterium]
MREELRLRLLEKLATGPKTAKDLAALLGVSQPTISRAINELRDQVVSLGRGRATMYVRPRPVRGTTSIFPVCRIDETGNVHLLGVLRTLVGGQYLWQPEGAGNENRLFDYLPWFIQDMRPDGFVGRAFAQRLATELGLPAKLNDWSDDDVLIALSRRGEDHIGNLVIGEESIDRYLRSTQKPDAGIPEHDRQHVYADLANAAMAGDPAGSSAGGEQPKFATVLKDDGENRHVLVKFSPALTSLEGRRWADLLHCEHLALELVRETGIAAASSRVLEDGNRVFLEVDRFDRTGTFGRTSLFSLRSLDSEYVGAGDDWARCAGGLLRAGVISAEDARRMRWLKLFGTLIGNTDMHLGNLSFIRVQSKFYTLAPVYDMLPMLYKPVSGETPLREFAPQAQAMDVADVWPEAVPQALRFWDMASDEVGVSCEFRQICRVNFAVLQSLEAGPRIVGR